MSTTLSTISRQCAVGTSSEFQVQSVYSSVPMPASSGGRMSWSAGSALGVVPDHQQAVADPDLVLLGARAQRHPPGVGDRLALAVATPAPVVERAGDLVALDRALGQVAAHVPAVAVEHVELALACPPDDELAAERLDAVRLAVREGRRPGPRQCQPRANRSGARAAVEGADARGVCVIVASSDLDRNENRL